MVAIIKEGTNKEIIKRLLNKIKTRKGLDTKKYCGKIKLSIDVLTIQQRLRNEWQ